MMVFDIKKYLSNSSSFHKSLSDQQLFIEKAQTMLDLTKQLNLLGSAFLDYFKVKMGNLSKLNKKFLNGIIC